jgi:hypothetical protein
MGFDTQQFMQEKFERRTKEVPVPALKGWFGKGDKVIWTVQNLNGYELGKANEIASKGSVSKAVLESLLSGHGEDVKKVIDEITGKGKSVPEDMAKRIEYLQSASVDPVCDLDLALKMFKEQVYTFLEITNAISELTSLGSMPGKSKPSGKTPKSK